MPAPANRERLNTLLQWIVTILVAGGIIAVLGARRDELVVLVDLSPGLIAAVSATVLLQFVTQGLVLRYVFEHFRATVGLAEAALIGLMDATLNYLPMKAGTVATGVVAAKRYHILLAEYAAGVTGATVINISVCATISGVLLLPVNTGLGLLLTLAPAASLFALVLWGRSHAQVDVEGSGIRYSLTRAARGVQGIYADHGLLARLVSANIVRLLAVSAQLYFSFQAVSTPIAASDAVIIGGFATVLGRLSIIPGGLGFREGGVVGAATLVGIDPTIALAASIIDRAVVMVWLIILGVPSTVYVSRTTRWYKSAEAQEGRQPEEAVSPSDAIVTGNVYDKQVTRNPIERRMVAGFHRDLDEIRALVDPESQLDIGCGEGALIARWAAQTPHARVVGLDLEDQRLREHWAGLDHPNLEFVTGSALELPYADDEFDVVSAIEVLEHVPDPEQALAEAVRVSRRYIIASVPREPLWRALNLCRGKYWSAVGNTPGHLQHWGRSEFVGLLGRYGTVREVRTPTPWTIALLELGR